MNTVLITGCSSGIGLASAIELKKQGFRVFATARDNASIKNLKQSDIETYRLDMNDSTQVQSVAQAVLNATNQQLFAVFNNAGFGQAGAVEDLSRDAIRAQFETNVFGAMELTNALLPAMRIQNQGRLIFNSSLLGIVAMPYRGAYNASKFALEGFCDTLRQELSDTQIKVCLVEPGPIESQFRAHAFEKFTQYINPAKSPHQKAYRQMTDRLNAQKSPAPFTLPAVAVAKKVGLILKSKNPKAHYPVTIPAHLAFWLRRALPTRLLDMIAKKVGK